jgi:hypothetical protein
VERTRPEAKRLEGAMMRSAQAVLSLARVSLAAAAEARGEGALPPPRARRGRGDVREHLVEASRGCGDRARTAPRGWRRLRSLSLLLRSPSHYPPLTPTRPSARFVRAHPPSLLLAPYPPIRRRRWPTQISLRGTSLRRARASPLRTRQSRWRGAALRAPAPAPVPARPRLPSPQQRPRASRRRRRGARPLRWVVAPRASKASLSSESYARGAARRPLILARSLSVASLRV